jgi:type II secretion system protein J
MSGRRGFTLVELLVTASMLALLGTAGYATLAAGTRSAQKARRVSDMVAHGRRALTMMATDIRAAVRHDEAGITALDAQFEGRDTDTIDFIAHRTRRSNDPEATDRCEVGYYIDTSERTEADWLLRREDATVDDEPLADGQALLAGPYVSELDLRFHNGSDWVDGWTDSENLPEAVRIGIVVLDAEEREDPLYLETTVIVPTR